MPSDPTLVDTQSQASASAPAPGLVSENLRWGQWLFRWRSYPPIVVLAYVLILVAVNPSPVGGFRRAGVWHAVGLALGLLGLLVRGKALGHVPQGTSGRGTRELRADTLNQEGLYSVVRHPLYLGNYFMWIGVAAFAGKPVAMLITTLLFWIYYERIMVAEERFLFERFGDVFGTWASKTPAFIPRLGGWVASPHPFSLRFCLGRDYQALYAFVASTTAIELVRHGARGRGWTLPPEWLWYFVAGTAAYFILDALKRRTKLLEPKDR